MMGGNELMFLLIGVLLGFTGFWLMQLIMSRSNRFAITMIEQDNLRLRHENEIVLSDNTKLREHVLDLEKRVHELEIKIKTLIGNV